tara:strand:- start:1361 stop:2086 length:726 start_codon:yes stop_codon:yes gene_type:complete
MSLNKKLWFICKTGAASLHGEPDFNSPCLTELVYGESAKINEKKSNWLNVDCEDGYNGWIHSFYGLESRSKKTSDYVIAFPCSDGLFKPSLPFGSRTKGSFSGSSPTNKKLGIEKVVQILNNLLGIPYKWGGKTSLGFDCSGLVQSVLYVCGFMVPRDAHQQKVFFRNSETTIDDSEPGDLHFFGKNGSVSHVGLSIGDSDFIHSQGVVKIDSLNETSKIFNKNLFDIYLSTCSIKRRFHI